MSNSIGNGPKGVYAYFQRTLQDSDFVNEYFPNSKQIFENYINNPEDNIHEFVRHIAKEHLEDGLTFPALSILQRVEKGVGFLKKSHRSHLVHSMNVMLLGICFVKEHSELRKYIYQSPGKPLTSSYEDDDNDTGEMDFYLRWICACIFHDIGYVHELLAKGLDPDGMGIGWQGIEELRNGLRRMKMGLQRNLREYMQELRHFPGLQQDDNYDDPEDWREIKASRDVHELMAYLISKSHGHVLGNEKIISGIIKKAFNESFQIGEENSFDHGKIGALIFLHEVRTIYLLGRKKLISQPIDRIEGWERENIYFEIMDAAIAIYLHNTLRFQLNDLWGPYSPLTIPPLSYLLLICDFLVEWDKPQVGYGDEVREISPTITSISSDPNKSISVKYKGEKKIANDVGSRIRKLIDLNFLDIQVTY